MKAQDVVVSMGAAVADLASSAKFVDGLMKRGFDPEAQVVARSHADFHRVATEIDKDLTSGQRSLALIERLIALSMLTPVRPNPGSAVKKAQAARDVLGVGRTDLERVWWLLLDAVHGKPHASECLDKIRSGRMTVTEAAQRCWGAAKGRKKEPKNTRIGASYVPKRKLTKDERAWVTRYGAEMRKLHDTPGRRAMVMAKALVERGLVDLVKFGGPAMGVEARALVAKALGVHEDEFRAAVTVLRKVNAGSFPAETIEAIESGRYRSCRSLAGGCVTTLEVVKDKEWLDCLARQMQSNTALITPTQKVLAYYDTVIAARVLDPLSQVSKNTGAVWDAACKAISDLSLTEAKHCWTLVRAVARKELPASALEGPRSGAISAGNAIGRSLSSLIRSHREQKRRKDTKAESPPERVKVYVSDVRATLSDDPLEDALRLTETTMETIVGIVSRAEENQDLELAGALRGLHEKASALNTRLTRMTTERVVKQ